MGVAVFWQGASSRKHSVRTSLWGSCLHQTMVLDACDRPFPLAFWRGPCVHLRSWEEGLCERRIQRGGLGCSSRSCFLDHFVGFFGKLGSPRTTATFVSPPQRVWLRRALTRERAVLPHPVTTRRKHQLRHRRTRNRGCELDCGGGGRHLVHRLALPVSIARFGTVGRWVHRLAASIANFLSSLIFASPPHWPRFW